MPRLCRDDTGLLHQAGTVCSACATDENANVKKMFVGVDRFFYIKYTSIHDEV